MVHNAKIADRIVLLEGSWLLPDGESLFLTFEDQSGDEINIKIELLTSPDIKGSKDKPKASLSVHACEGVAVIQFRDWNSAFGNSTGEPVVFATSSDGTYEVSFLASVAKLSKIFRVEFQVMAEMKQ